MNVEFVLLCILIACLAYLLGLISGNKKIGNKENDESINTRDLLIKSLEEIGCQYKIGDKNEILFKYQGEEFEIWSSNDSYIIYIYDMSQTGFDINDADAENFKLAINKANKYSGVTNLYTIDEEKGYIVAHCQFSVYFASYIPDYIEYLKSVLDVFFTAHQCVIDVFTKLKNNQK